MNYELAKLELLPLMKDGKTNKEINVKIPSLRNDTISWYRGRFIKDSLLDKQFKMLRVHNNGNTRLRTKLTPSAQQILNLHKEGKTVKEIVATIHKSEDSVKSSLYRLKQKGKIARKIKIGGKVTTTPIIPTIIPTGVTNKTINFIVNGTSVTIEQPAKVISIGKNRFTIDF